MSNSNDSRLKFSPLEVSILISMCKVFASLISLYTNYRCSLVERAMISKGTPTSHDLAIFCRRPFSLDKRPIVHKEGESLMRIPGTIVMYEKTKRAADSLDCVIRLSITGGERMA